MNAGAATRSLLWAFILSALTAVLASLLAAHAIGPAVVALIRPTQAASWNAVIAGLSLTVAGALLVLALSRLVVLPPGLAAAGVATGALWLALVLGMVVGLDALWANLVGLALRLALTALAGGVAYAVAAAVGLSARTPSRGGAPAPAGAEVENVHATGSDEGTGG